MFDVHSMIPTRQILGLRFFNGDVDEAVAFMHRHGGYLVAPSGTCFARLREDETYRRAMLSADLAIADSGLMVLTVAIVATRKDSAHFRPQISKTTPDNTETRGKRHAFSGSYQMRARDRNCWIVFATKVFRLRSKTAMSRPGTDRKSKIEIFSRC